MDLLFSHPGENLGLQADSVTVTLGTTLAQYGIENAHNGNPARPVKFAETSVKIRWSFLSPVLPELPILYHTNLTVAAHLKGNNTTNFASPASDSTFAVPTVRAGRFTAPWLNLTALAPQLHWELSIAGNAYAVVLGEVWYASVLRGLVNSYRFENHKPVSMGDTIVKTTINGSELAYMRTPQLERFEGDLLLDYTTDLPKVLALLDAVRFRARPFPFIVSASSTDAWFVKLMSDEVPTPRVANRSRLLPFPVKQVSLGDTWIDA